MLSNTVLAAVISSASTLAAVALVSAAGGGLPAVLKLDNTTVRITEVTYPPGVPRPRSVRATDQVIVFLDACRYERLDSKTGEKTVRTRNAGDVLWHDKGEDAPQLTNLGSKPYRTLLIELKQH
jgi:hypothetical protein